MSSVELPYTPGHTLEFELPSHVTPHRYVPAPVNPEQPPEALLAAALATPLASEPLERRVRSHDRVLIICDDATRPTPAYLLLPGLLQSLNRCGVRDAQIEILFATGTHRGMSEDEMRAKVGAETFARVTCSNHNAFERSELHYFGRSEDGIEVWLNRRVAEASFVIAVGNIAPHAIVGYAGGAKILYPGVAGEETIAGFHVTYSLYPENSYGVFPTPAREGIRRLADHTGLQFVVNTVLNAEGQVCSVFAGEHEAVLRAGYRVARQIFGAPTRQRYPVVIAGSYPHWIDFWQGCKGLFAGATLARPGGEIIVVTACPEGSAPGYPNHPTYVGTPTALLAERLRRGDLPDPICAAGAIKVGYLREQYRVTLVSDGLSPADVQAMGFERAATVEEALSSALARAGNPDEIGFIPLGGETYCYLEQ